MVHIWSLETPESGVNGTRVAHRAHTVTLSAGLHALVAIQTLLKAFYSICLHNLV